MRIRSRKDLRTAPRSLPRTARTPAKRGSSRMSVEVAGTRQQGQYSLPDDSRYRRIQKEQNVWKHFNDTGTSNSCLHISHRNCSSSFFHSVISDSLCRSSMGSTSLMGSADRGRLADGRCMGEVDVCTRTGVEFKGVEMARTDARRTVD